MGIFREGCCYGWGNDYGYNFVDNNKIWGKGNSFSCFCLWFYFYGGGFVCGVVYFEFLKFIFFLNIFLIVC